MIADVTGYRARDALRRKAQDALVRAAAACTNDPPDLAFAIMETGIALVHLCKLDGDEKARDFVVAACRRIQEERA